jgi:Yip1 domain
MASATLPSAEVPERGNSFGRIFGVLFTPKATFQSIVRRPTWLVPVIMLAILALGAVMLFGHRGGWPSYFERQMASNSRVQQLNAQQRQQALQIQLKIAVPATYAITPVAPLLVVLVIAAIFLGIFNGVAGTKLGFKTSMGIVAYAHSPGIISGLLAVLVISLKDATTVDLQNIVASSAAAFLPDTAPRWMVALLGSLDIFSFWTMILMAIGYSAAAPKKLSVGKAFAWIFSVWLIYVLAKVGLTAAFS